MNSPFPYETYAEGITFCGREEEKQQILNYAIGSNNLVIYSKRRLGKSSLIREVFRDTKDFIFIYCDFFEITSKEEFGAILLGSLSNSIKGDIKTVLKRLSGIFKRVTLTYSADPQTGEVSLKPEIRALSFEQMLEEFFNTIFELSKKQRIVVALDEFQQISTIPNSKIDASIRKYMQKNFNISYFFLGSKRHMLSELFSYSAPLFEEATSMLLQPLKLEDVQNYVSSHLNISNEAIAHIYNYCDGETKLMQHIFHVLYSYKKKKIDGELIEQAITEIINAKSAGYKQLFDSFSPFQKKAFKALSKYKNNIHKKEILDEFGISKGTMQSALKQLYKRELVDKEDDIWFIPDRGLEIWGESLTDKQSYKNIL